MNIVRRRQAHRKPTAETAALHIAGNAKTLATLEGIPGDAGESCELENIVRHGQRL